MYQQGMKSLIEKLLKHPGECKTSKEWVPKRTHTGYEVEVVDGGYHLFMCERWPSGRRVERLVRFTVSDDFVLSPWMDVRAPKATTRYPLVAQSNILRYAAHAMAVTTVEQGGTWEGVKWMCFDLVNAPRYVYVDETHRCAATAKKLMVLRTWGGRTVLKTVAWRAKPFMVRDPEDVRATIIDPEGWVRIHSDGRTKNLTPLNIPIARCDFKLARSNGKAAFGVESTALNFCRISGMEIVDLLSSARKEVSNKGTAGPDAIVTTTALQEYYDTHEEVTDLHKLSYMMGRKFVRATSKTAEKFGVAVLDHEQARYAGYRQVPAMYKLTPVRASAFVTTANTYEEMEAYAESFSRA